MLQKYWLRLPIYLIAFGLVIASQRWPQATNIATILLLLVTFEYVSLTHSNLELFRHQLQRQEKVFLHLDLIVINNKVFVRAANLGMSNFLVTGMRVRKQDEAVFEFPAHKVVVVGDVDTIEIPKEAYADHPLSVDLEIVLEYIGLDTSGKTEPKVFNISMGLDEVPASAKEGLDGVWSVKCPACGKGYGGLLLMSLKGLKTFEEAFARKKAMETDFKDSCPNHASKLMMKVEEQA
jgi:hypothetical protein